MTLLCVWRAASPEDKGTEEDSKQASHAPPDAKSKSVTASPAKAAPKDLPPIVISTVKVSLALSLALFLSLSLSLSRSLSLSLSLARARALSLCSRTCPRFHLYCQGLSLPLSLSLSLSYVRVCVCLCVCNVRTYVRTYACMHGEVHRASAPSHSPAVLCECRAYW